MRSARLPKNAESGRRPCLWQSFLKLLKFPLHAESFLVILLFWFLIGVYALGYTMLALVPIGFSVDFLDLVVSSSLLCLFFEYGLEIIQASQTSATSPPPLSYQTIRGKRFAQQVLFLTMLEAVAQFLGSRDLGYLALLLVLVYIAFLPAMQIVIATSHSFAEMINPLALFGVSWIMGWRYIVVTIYASLVAFFVYASYTSSINLFVLTAPITLYALIILFRLLGEFYEESQPKPTESNEVNGLGEEDRESRRALTIQLGKLYEEKRSSSLKHVYQRLLTIARFNNWSRFDLVFDVVSAWDDKKPALWLIMEYLPQLKRENNSVKAFKLCQWGQMWKLDFHPAEADTLSWLQKHSATDEQRRSLALMEEACLAKEHVPQ